MKLISFVILLALAGMAQAQQSPKPDAAVQDALRQLQEQIDRQVREYQKSGSRKVFAAARASDPEFQSYVDAVYDKIERVGTLNYPAEARGTLYGTVQLTWEVLPDGSVSKIEVNRGSGYRVLDSAAVRSIQMAAPLAAFTAKMRERADILVLTRTFHFVRGAQIKVLSGNGARAAVSELATRFERESGHKVAVHFAVNVETKKKIEGGEVFDVAILNPPVLDDLIKQGRIVRETRAVLGRSGIGMGVREGVARPDISTVDSFKRTLLAAKSVAYPGEGASGKYFVSVVERLGLTSQMQPKMRPMPAEYNVEMVARGEADLVVVVASRIAGVPGVQLVGRIPQELQTWIGFTAGVSSAAKEPEAARAMLRFFTSPAAAPVLSATGIEPFVE